MGLGCVRGLVGTRRSRVSQKCFNTVGRARSRSNTFGACGSRKSRSFHKGHWAHKLNNSRSADCHDVVSQSLRTTCGWECRWHDKTFILKSIKISTIIHSHHNQWTSAQVQNARTVDARHVKQTMAGTMMRLRKTFGNRRHLAKICQSGNAQTPRHGSVTGTGKGSGKGSG